MAIYQHQSSGVPGEPISDWRFIAPNQRLSEFGKASYDDRSVFAKVQR